MPLPPTALLGIAIVAEVAATTALKASDGFTRLLPSVVCVLGYGLAFYMLSLVMKSLPTGVVYAVWSGLGIVLISALGWLLHGQKLDLAALLGIGLIVAGVAVIQLFSKTAAH
ncbi:QacE family quaternary ammonium compound efflux SMR transporter [Acidovorax sp. YS12]|nr:QacE family quaternary ammonium compound efflux SMR transporter [Acidovorax sp. YS12]